MVGLNHMPVFHDHGCSVSATVILDRVGVEQSGSAFDRQTGKRM